MDKLRHWNNEMGKCVMGSCLCWPKETDSCLHWGPTKSTCQAQQGSVLSVTRLVFQTHRLSRPRAECTRLHGVCLRGLCWLKGYLCFVEATLHHTVNITALSWRSATSIWKSITPFTFLPCVEIASCSCTEQDNHWAESWQGVDKKSCQN